MTLVHPSAMSIPAPVLHRDRAPLPNAVSDFDHHCVVTALACAKHHECSARVVPDASVNEVLLDDHPGSTDRSP